MKTEDPTTTEARELLAAAMKADESWDGRWLTHSIALAAITAALNLRDEARAQLGMERVVDFMVEETLAAPDEIILAEGAATAIKSAVMESISDRGCYHIDLHYPTLEAMQDAHRDIVAFLSVFTGETDAPRRASEARSLALEEAAKIADGYGDSYADMARNDFDARVRCSSVACDIHNNIAAAIRALGKDES